MKSATQTSRPLRIATVLVAVMSLVAVVGRAIPEIEITRIIAGASVLAFIIFGAMMLRSTLHRNSIKGRMTRRIGGCKLCGLDPSIDDSDEPALKGRCIECGRAKAV